MSAKKSSQKKISKPMKSQLAEMHSLIGNAMLHNQIIPPPKTNKK